MRYNLCFPPAISSGVIFFMLILCGEGNEKEKIIVRLRGQCDLILPRSYTRTSCWDSQSVLAIALISTIVTTGNFTFEAFVNQFVNPVA